jgi:hypothetical protein
MSQLEFDFKTLNREQEERVGRFVSTSANNVAKEEHEVYTIENMLTEAGFVKGVDFENTFKRLGLVTKTKSFGYGEDKFETEVTFEDYEGNIVIKYQYFNKSKNQITNENGFIRREGNKLECTSITSQYRAYKPTSLLQKLKDNNAQAQYDFKSHNRKLSILNHTLEKYKTKYPNAQVGVTEEYSRYRTYTLVQVKFENGSYVSFELGHENDKERIHTVRNTVMDSMSAIEILDMFNNQNK